MTALKVLIVLLLALFLLGLIRVGGGAEYTAEGLNAWVLVGIFHIRLLPAKGKKKEKKPKKKKREAPREEESKPGGGLAAVKRYLPLVGEAAGELKSRIRIDDLRMDYTVAGGEDAAAAAMSFGYANAAIGVLLPVFEQNFQVKSHRLRTAVDFNSNVPRLYIKAAFSARIGQLISFALRFGWKLLRLYLQDRKPKNAKKEAI